MNYFLVPVQTKFRKQKLILKVEMDAILLFSDFQIYLKTY